MIKVLNSRDANNNLKLATDQECADRRKALIAGGVIRPAPKSEVVFRKNAVPVVSTKRARRRERRRLIEKGIIDPTYCELRPSLRTISTSEEAVYQMRPINSHEEYERRKAAYFRILQEVLRSRKELDLILAPRKSDDPDWYF